MLKNIHHGGYSYSRINAMLKKHNRLTKNQYDKVLSDGKYYHSPFFMYKYLNNSDDKRFSVVIPKKILKSAVKRNSLRRFVYKTLQEQFDNLKSTEGIFIAKKPIVDKKSEEIEEEILKILTDTNTK